MNILATDAAGLLKLGRRFRPGIYTGKGYYKPADPQASTIGSEFRFAVAMPSNANAKLFIDSDLRVEDEVGRALTLRRSSTPITLTPGAREVTFRLVVK